MIINNPHQAELLAPMGIFHGNTGPQPMEKQDTTYVKNPFLLTDQQYLNDRPWFREPVLNIFGSEPMVNGNKQEKPLGAKTKVSDDLEYPDGVETEPLVLVRKLKRFNDILGLDELDYNAFIAGNRYITESMRRKIDNVEFAHQQELVKWSIGYSTTWTGEPDYDSEWVPFLDAKAASTVPGDPGDMNGQVTNIAGTTGTTGTILSMGTTLTSTTTNQTIDFVKHTFLPIIQGFTSFVDSNSGRRMVQTTNQVSANSIFYCLMDPSAINAIMWEKLYDGEKVILAGPTVLDEMNKRNIFLVPTSEFTASLAEDGTVQFGFVADPKTNFIWKIAVPRTWKEWEKIPGRNVEWLRKATSRLTCLTIPYSDGTDWHKAFFHGTFVYKNDAA
jgi:hypothetical protein